MPSLLAVRTFATGAAVLIASAAAAQVTPLAITQGVSGNAGRTGDSYQWTDSAGRTRQAVLARNNVSGGGFLDRYSYGLSAGGARVVNATSGGAGGFGYVVSHARYVDNCATDPNTQYCELHRWIGDDSPLGRGFTGTYAVRFAGRHHAIHEFRTTYPRVSGPHPPGNTFVRYQLPVTIQWFFANGRDHPVWTVTWDWSATPPNLPLAEQIEGDARGPYGEMEFAGVSGGEIGGIAWAVDQRRFATTTAPFTLSSQWNWASNGRAAIPFNQLWVNGGNAQMGVVQTSLLSTHDAGNGGYAGNFQGLTSAAGMACPAEGYRLFCVWDWPFQSVENDFWGAAGLNINATTTGRRFAWGAKLGAIGRSSYDNYVGATVNQPRYKSYSTAVVLGEHNPAQNVNPTAAVLTEYESILMTGGASLTASVGSIPTTGPAGVGRSDTQTWTRPGWNPVYGTWEATAAGNAVTVNWAIPAGDTLRNPVLRVRNYSAGVAPSVVRWNGAVLVADTDVLLSVDSANAELWVTVLRTLSGASNTLDFGAAAAVCTMDVDGDGSITPTTDGLVIVRAMLGLTEAAAQAAAPAAPRRTWSAIRPVLTACGMNVAP